MATLTPTSYNTAIIPPAVIAPSNVPVVSKPATISAPTQIRIQGPTAPITTASTPPIIAGTPVMASTPAPPVGVNHEITTRQPVTFRTEQPGVVEQRTTTRVVPPAQPTVPMANSKASPTENYWVTPETCHPGRQPYKCPIGIYIGILVLMAVINIWAIFRAPRINNKGKAISTSLIWYAAIIGVAFHLVFGLLLGWWIFESCRSCHGQNRHVIFLLAVTIPIILGLITGVIIGNVMNIGFLWTASREPNPESSNVTL